MKAIGVGQGFAELKNAAQRRFRGPIQRKAAHPSPNVAARIVQPPFSIGMMKSRRFTDEASMMTIGWLAVLLGVIAVQWADGRFPFAA